jgi:hypothetical protein
MFREIMAIRTSQMMTSRSLICLLENQNGGNLQKTSFRPLLAQKLEHCRLDIHNEHNTFSSSYLVLEYNFLVESSTHMNLGLSLLLFGNKAFICDSCLFPQRRKIFGNDSCVGKIISENFYVTKCMAFGNIF